MSSRSAIQSNFNKSKMNKTDEDRRDDNRSDHRDSNDWQKQRIRDIDANMQRNGYMVDNDREWLRSNGFRDDEIVGAIWRTLHWWV